MLLIKYIISLVDSLLVILLVTIATLDCITCCCSKWSCSGSRNTNQIRG